MKRMKTFLIYFLIFIGFFAFSVLMEVLYLYNTYVSIKDNGIVVNSNGIVVEVNKAKATRINGVISLKAQNNSGEKLNSKYIKIELIDSQDLIAAVKYISIEQIDKNQTIDYKIAFKANDIKQYKVSITNEGMPDEHNIIEVGSLKIDIDNMIVTIGDVAHRLPDFVYTLMGIWTSLKTGEIMWFVIFVL